jgi:hypothetical protein
MFLQWLRTIAGAVSRAETGPYAGAPRDPDLRIGDEQDYSTIRYATEHVAYTTISADAGACPGCGGPLGEIHGVEQVTGADGRLSVGSVRACHNCRTGTWLRRSGMPSAARARAAARRYIV